MANFTNATESCSKHLTITHVEMLTTQDVWTTKPILLFRGNFELLGQGVHYQHYLTPETLDTCLQVAQMLVDLDTSIVCIIHDLLALLARRRTRNVFT